MSERDARTGSDATDPTSVERDRGLPPDVPEDEALVQRNAASGGWQGVTEVIENDFEVQRLEQASDRGADDDAGDDTGSDGETDDPTPLT